MFVVTTPFIRRTASRTASETAASAFSAAANASCDAGDDGEYNEGANDDGDNNRPPVRKLAGSKKTVNVGETYLQYACDMHPFHEDKELLMLLASLVTGFCRISRTPMVATMSNSPGSVLTGSRPEK